MARAFLVLLAGVDLLSCEHTRGAAIQALVKDQNVTFTLLGEEVQLLRTQGFKENTAAFVVTAALKSRPLELREKQTFHCKPLKTHPYVYIL